jgi:tRNA pseudouridine13 synthase
VSAHALSAVFGGPVLRARLRVEADDFQVEEVLGFDPDGEGEHLLLSIEKVGANTEWVAQRLAAFVGVPRSAVSFAGLKDRHARTRQSFSLHLPGRADPDFSTWVEAGVRVLGAVRHRRKLPRGALRGNRFGIRLRDVEGDREGIERRLQALAREGFPNAFGDQRFGRDGGNVAAAERWFRHGGRVTRARRSLLLSSARSALFNALLAKRMADGSWGHLVAGDVAVLAGSRSWFAVGDPVPADLAARAQAGDLHPSGPLWGRGPLPSGARVADMERSVSEAHPGLAAGLEAAGLKQDRRALRALAQDLQWRWEDEATLRLRCQLDAGTYMTSLLAALGDIEDVAGGES